MSYKIEPDTGYDTTVECCCHPCRPCNGEGENDVWWTYDNHNRAIELTCPVPCRCEYCKGTGIDTEDCAVHACGEGTLLRCPDWELMIHGQRPAFSVELRAGAWPTDDELTTICNGGKGADMGFCAELPNNRKYVFVGLFTGREHEDATEMARRLR